MLSCHFQNLKKFPFFFPKLRFLNSEIIIIDFISHDGKKNKNYHKKLALLLADIGKSIGFKVKNIIVARAMNTSSQQLQELTESKLRRESIIFLQK